MKNLNNIRIFSEVAEARSFKQAAQRLNLTASAVSKAVSSLESDIGVRLFNRTTRSVSLTTDGATFFECCKTILVQIEESETAINSTRESVRGRIRLQVPPALGRRIVMPALRAFCQRYPNITIDAEVTARAADPAYDAVDIAVVIGPVTDDRLIARKLCDLQFWACASPGYIKAHGEPQTPDALDRHQCLGYIVPYSGRYREWTFVKGDRTYTKTLFGQLNMNNSESLLEAAISGAGVVMLSTLVTADAIRTGKVRRVLSDYSSPGPTVSAVYLPNRYLSWRVRALLEFLQEIIPTDGS